MAEKSILTFIVTVHNHQKRRDLENVFIARHVRTLIERFEKTYSYFHFVRHWVEGDGYGDSLWLRFKVTPAVTDEIRTGVWAFLKALEDDPHVEKVWEPLLQSEEEVFGTAPSMGPVSGFGSLWCFLDATCRTAVNLIMLDHQGRLDVPEWVVADLWVDFFYNALGVPDFARCPGCGSESSIRIPRCHACGMMPAVATLKPQH